MKIAGVQALVAEDPRKNQLFAKPERPYGTMDWPPLFTRGREKREGGS